MMAGIRARITRLAIPRAPLRRVPFFHDMPTVSLRVIPFL